MKPEAQFSPTAKRPHQASLHALHFCLGLSPFHCETSKTSKMDLKASRDAAGKGKGYTCAFSGLLMVPPLPVGERTNLLNGGPIPDGICSKWRTTRTVHSRMLPGVSPDPLNSSFHLLQAPAEGTCSCPFLGSFLSAFRPCAFHLCLFPFLSFLFLSCLLGHPLDPSPPPPGGLQTSLSCLRILLSRISSSVCFHGVSSVKGSSTLLCLGLGPPTSQSDLMSLDLTPLLLSLLCCSCCLGSLVNLSGSELPIPSAPTPRLVVEAPLEESLAEQPLPGLRSSEPPLGESLVSPLLSPLVFLGCQALSWAASPGRMNPPGRLFPSPTSSSSRSPPTAGPARPALQRSSSPLTTSGMRWGWQSALGGMQRSTPQPKQIPLP